jgi:hypothetical protein
VDMVPLHPGEALTLNALPSLSGSVMPQDGVLAELTPELLRAGDGSEAQRPMPPGERPLISTDVGA